MPVAAPVIRPNCDLLMEPFGPPRLKMKTARPYALSSRLRFRIKAVVPAKSETTFRRWKVPDFHCRKLLIGGLFTRKHKEA